MIDTGDDAGNPVLRSTFTFGNSQKGIDDMSRVSSMTIGLVLVFLGAQLFLVKSYLLSPTATRFAQEHFSANNGSRFAGGSTSNGWLDGWNGNVNQDGSSISNSRAGQSWPYYQAGNTGSGGNGGVYQNSSYNSNSQSPGSSLFASGNNSTGAGKRVVPPGWIMWPALFLGAIFFLHGAALRS